MSYTDSIFLLTLGAAFLASAAVPRLSYLILIAFSLLFLATWGYFDAITFLCVASINYLFSYLLEITAGSRRKIVLACGITLNLLILGYFKYRGFLFGHRLLFSQVQLELGIPLAISFYTFHVISYLVDQYKGTTARTRFVDFLFYLSFFPHLVAGPIIRAWQFLPQLAQPRLRRQLAMGAHYFVTGFFLKSVGADNIGASIDQFWVGAGAQGLNAADRWLVAGLYYFQIYSDFAGYSLMALGAARLFGYRFPANFRRPMRARSLQEFWRRWHVTLSRWLRDYLYIPLGGSRHGSLRTAVSLNLTMLLGGLWHGAGLNFVVWGAMHGIGLTVERAFGRHGGWLLGWLACQLWVTLAWVMFRVPSVRSGVDFIAAMFAPGSVSALVPHMTILQLLPLTVPALLHHVAPLSCYRLHGVKRTVAIGVLTGAMLVVLLLMPSSRALFIYFKF